SHDRVGKAAIGLVGNRVRELAVLAADERPALPEGEAGEAAHGRELEPDERGVEAADRRTPKHAAVVVVQVAVGCLGLEQPGYLVDETVENCGNLELAAQDLRCAQKR